MNAVREIITVPATVPFGFNPAQSPLHRRRTAAYARVSTDTEEQLSSYEAQVEHYTQYIQANPNWEFVGVYTDEGISATSMKRREGFKQMVRDALEGKIDLIITKSVSRFARNTVDSLATIRELKDKGVEVYFEKDNVYTFDSKGELLITLLSSLAQEESRSISENVAWGQRKRFADGKVSLPYKRFLGFEKGENGLPKIVPGEAEIVRLIYQLFLDGKTPSGIAKILMQRGIPAPGGRMKWGGGTVESILTNEKYKGEAVLQKTFTVNFLTKAKKANEGELQQYHIKNSHPAIISPEVHDLVQDELRRRKQSGRRYSGQSCFSSRIVCGDCGTFYGSKVWHANDRYRRVIWQCNGKYKGAEKCTTSHLTDEELKQAFVMAFNERIAGKEQILLACEQALEIVLDLAPLERQVKGIEMDLLHLSDDLRRLVDENARRAMDQAEYARRYGELQEREKKLRDLRAAVDAQSEDLCARRNNIRAYMEALRGQDALSEFDESLWLATVEELRVLADGSLVFCWRDGSETEQKS